MARQVEAIREEIRALSTSDKETLLRSLVEDLDAPFDPIIDAAWLEESQRRGREIDAGVVTAVPASAAFDEIEASLKK
jgi:hypothetical protein